ncbi:hypothetical protein CLI64_10980 [Nostoc sp. CENA543]|uniref:hypothetical protein n=1 Tax=Nostoc sp. CENA543 TaxID=1869241 RepID=UPI000CA28330|nr:hypothetical protein [Nostoc sp. CENA543]AUT00877.1 hypothetical protein CLI64_10980 [Nostoc sp. CENA543]
MLEQDIEQLKWKELAYDTNDWDTQIFVGGALAATTFITYVSASLPAGLLVGGCLWFYGLKKTNEISFRDELIDRGVVSHILKESDLRKYEASYGLETVLNEIQTAVDLGHGVSPHAVNLFNSKVDEPAPLPAQVDSPQPTNDTDWIELILDRTTMIHGLQGSGKSWLARYAVKKKKELGHRIIVLDSNSNPYEWRGVHESYHTHQDIEAKVSWYVDELDHRLEEFRNLNCPEDEWASKLQPISLVCEETSTWSNWFKDKALLKKFGMYAITMSRKPLMPVLVIGHSETQEAFFGLTGMGNTVKNMQKVRCIGDKKSLKPKSLGIGQLKLEGDDELRTVKLPRLTSKITEF